MRKFSIKQCHLRLRRLCIVQLVVLTCLNANRESLAETTLEIDELVVTLIDSVDVPSAETGVVSELFIREGQTATAGQVIAKLDERQAAIQQELSQTQLEIARWSSKNDRSIDLARKKLAEEEQRAKRQDVITEIAKRKGDNSVRVESSSKAEAVAKNELDRAIQARLQFVDSVSQSEIDGLRLSHDKSRLETKQAAFEQEIDSLSANAELETAAGITLAIDRAQIDLAQAEADSKLSELQVTLHEQQSKLAEQTVLKHRVTSPLDGLVVELFRKVGDWVTAGEPIARIIRVNRLRAEGFIPLSQLQLLRNNRDVTLTIFTGDDDESKLQREGQIVFISPEVDPVSSKVEFWVEFENPKVDVLPGMRLSLSAKSVTDAEP